jgi:hypothetical protein
VAWLLDFKDFKAQIDFGTIVAIGNWIPQTTPLTSPSFMVQGFASGQCSAEGLLLLLGLWISDRKCTLSGVMNTILS